jgi:hypothetical protein
MRSKTFLFVAVTLCTLLWSSVGAQITVGVFDPGTPTMTKVYNQDLMGNNYRFFDLKQGETCETCMDSCLKDPRCRAYTYTKPGYQASNGRCYLKFEVPAGTVDVNCISGIKTINTKDPMAGAAQPLPAFTPKFEDEFALNQYLSYPKGDFDNLKEATDYCRNCRDKGYTDWRVPTYEELADYIGYFPLDYLRFNKSLTPSEMQGQNYQYFFITKTPFIAVTIPLSAYPIHRISKRNTRYFESTMRTPELDSYLYVTQPLKDYYGHFLINVLDGNTKGTLNFHAFGEEFINNAPPLEYNFLKAPFYPRNYKFNCICIRGHQ